MGHAHQLAAHADPDVAVAIGERGVEQRDVGPDRRHEQDRIVRGEGIVDDPPVRPVAHQVRAEHAAQRHERHALLGRLQPGMDRGAGGVPDLDRTGRDRRDEPGCGARPRRESRRRPRGCARRRRRSGDPPESRAAARRSDADPWRRAGSGPERRRARSRNNRERARRSRRPAPAPPRSSIVDLGSGHRDRFPRGHRARFGDHSRVRRQSSRCSWPSARKAARPVASSNRNPTEGDHELGLGARRGAAGGVAPPAARAPRLRTRANRGRGAAALAGGLSPDREFGTASPRPGCCSCRLRSRCTLP